MTRAVPVRRDRGVARSGCEVDRGRTTTARAPEPRMNVPALTSSPSPTPNPSPRPGRSSPLGAARSLSALATGWPAPVDASLPNPRSVVLRPSAARATDARSLRSLLAAAAASTHLCRIELCRIERGLRSLETAELVTRAVPARRDRGREAPRPLLEAAVQSACASRGWREVDEQLIEARKERSGAESDSGPERASDPHVVASRPAAACYRHSPPLAAESSSAESSSA